MDSPVPHSAVVGPPAVAEMSLEVLADEPAWTDLALNRPGPGVRAEAESLVAMMTTPVASQVTGPSHRGCPPC